MPLNTSNSVLPNPPLQVTIHPLADQNGSGTAAPATSGTSGQFWSGETPNFKDLLDTINPLQHIPVISSIYQSLTGDIPSSGANIAGGALMGGAVGLTAAVFNEVIKTQTGKDVGGNMLALIDGESSSATQSANSSVAFNYAPSPTNRAAYSAYQHAQSMFA